LSSNVKVKIPTGDEKEKNTGETAGKAKALRRILVVALGPSEGARGVDESPKGERVRAEKTRKKMVSLFSDQNNNERDKLHAVEGTTGAAPGETRTQSPKEH